MARHCCIAALCLMVLHLANGQHVELIQAFMNTTQSYSHLVQVAHQAPKIPYPHSETFMSYKHSDTSPCSSRSVEPYRRASGVCNNLRHPFQGAALDTQRRLFTSSYLDVHSFPRTRDSNLYELPSARLVSNECFGSESDQEGNAGNGKQLFVTQMTWQFSQLLAHDITHLEKTDGSSTCCDNYDPRFPHEALYRIDDKFCFPIEIPKDDTFFKNHSCMHTSRSFGVNLYGIREPINAVTSYIDASTVYGSSQAFQNKLRAGVRGHLKTHRIDGHHHLPDIGDFPCTMKPKIPRCPAAGDVRVNDQPGLASLHTLFHLEHNRIAQGLFELNRFWDDEKLFQEARKIISAITQKIVYYDFLPLLVGNDVMEAFDLNKDYVYDDSIDAGAILDFTTSGLRFGHTLINDFVGGHRLRDLFFEPIYAKHLDYHTFPFLQANQTAQKFNNRFTDEIRHHLFEGIKIEGFDPSPLPAFDLLALNIQRGRDHGIAPYVKVRDMCLDKLWGIAGVYNSTPECFQKGVYKNAEDVDLFVGGMSEESLPGAVLGPTFACMTAIQFRRLKFGDRFFFESRTREGIHYGRREFIHKNTLSSLICELNPDLYIQRDAFRPESASNPRVPCKVLMNERNLKEGLKLWQEPTEYDDIELITLDAPDCTESRHTDSHEEEPDTPEPEPSFGHGYVGEAEADAW